MEMAPCERWSFMGGGPLWRWALVTWSFMEGGPLWEVTPYRGGPLWTGDGPSWRWALMTWSFMGGDPLWSWPLMGGGPSCKGGTSEQCLTCASPASSSLLVL